MANGPNPTTGKPDLLCAICVIALAAELEKKELIAETKAKYLVSNFNKIKLL